MNCPSSKLGNCANSKSDTRAPHGPGQSESVVDLIDAHPEGASSSSDDL